ncbi:MAG: hypothetical protein IJ280_05430 [Bacteroidales bacterium]|nr:hypothetical protein [Bacteroidales bacterium]
MIVIAIFLIFAVLITFFVLISNNQKNANLEYSIKLFEEETKQIEGFENSKRIISKSGLFSFIINDDHQKIRFYHKHGPIEKVFNYKDIISVELIEDGVISFQKSTSRTIGGALVGSALGGDTGAIIGGLSGPSVQTKDIYKIQVKLHLRNQEDPSFYFECYDKFTYDYDDLIGHHYGKEEATLIVDYISSIIDKIDQEHKTQLPQPSTSSIADELDKLYALKEKGILNDNEFIVLKDNLMKNHS